MKNLTLSLLILFVFSASSNLFAQNVSINIDGSVADTSAILDVSSTTKGFLMPRMTTVQRDAIVLPAKGLIIFNISLSANQVNTGTPAAPIWSTLGTGSGSVTSVSVASANGFGGTVANATTTPAITLTTSVNGMVKGNGTAISQATSGFDYSPGTAGNATGIVKSINGTGALVTAVASDFPTLNQNTTGSAAKLTTGRTIGITGDLTYTSNAFDGSANVTGAGTLATVNTNVGSFTNANITVNGKGLITAASNGTGGTLTNINTGYGVSGGPITTTGTIIVDSAALSLKYLRISDTANIRPRLVAGSNVTITGTYPNLTVNSTSPAGTGTVTNINTGYGVSGGPITTTGTIIVDSAALSLKYLRISDTANIRPRLVAGSNVTITGTYPNLTVNSTSPPGTGTVTNINTGYGISGGPISTNGTIKVDTSALSLKYLRISDTANIRPRLVAGSNVTITGTYPNLTINSTSPPGTGTVTSISQGYGIINTPNPIVTTGTVAIDSAALSLKYVKIADTAAMLTPYLRNIDTTNIANFYVKVRSLFSATAPITYSNGLIGITQSGISSDGYLSSADWNMFNNKADSTTGWSVKGNSGINPVTNFLGTKDNNSLRFRTNNTQQMKIDSTGNVAIGQDTFDPANPEKVVINAGTTGSVNALVIKGSINNYLQMNIKNNSNGSNATSDIVATSDNGTESSNYVDLGINGSGYTGGAIQTGVANDGYLISAGNDFYLVNSTPNKNMLFLTGGTGVANERMRILANGRVGMGVQDPTAPFVVKDTMEIRRVGPLSQLLFSKTAGSGDFRIGGDGGDIFWQGGGGRGLQMGSYWTTILTGDRQTGTYPSFVNTPNGTGVLVLGQRDASVPLAIQAFSGTQSADLTQWRNSAGTVLSTISKDGYFGIGNSAPTEKLDVSGNIKFSGALMPNNNAGTAGYVLTSNGAGAAPAWNAASTTSFWNTSGNASTTTANFLGTTDNNSLKFKTNSIQGMIIDNNQNVAIGTSPTFSPSNPEKLLVDAGTTSYNVISGKGNLNNYLQLNIKNTNSGMAASSDVVATNDAGTEVNGMNYIDMGVNSSGYSSGGILGGANNAYLYSTGNDLIIGNTTASMPLRLFTTNASAISNEAMRIDPNGYLGVGTTTPAQKLDVSGNFNLSGAFMPNNLAGSAGYVLTSAGAGSPPTWNAPGNQSITFTATGDVTGTATGTSSISPALVIGTNKVLNTMLAKMAALTIKGNNTGSPANAADLTGAQVNTILPVFTSTLNGLVPFSGGGTANFLRADGTWTSPSASSWSINGNAGTSAASNFLGTTDAQDLVFKANNIERMRIVNGVSAVTGTAGDITIGDATSGTLRTNKELVMREDGDLYGPSGLHLRNRTGQNGAIFETLGASAALVDFIFQTGTTASPIQTNLRFETRSSALFVAGNSTEWQIGQAASPTMVFSAGTSGNSALIRGNFGIANSNPSEKLDVTGNVKFSGALMPNNQAGTAGYVLTSAGAGSAPTWNAPGNQSITFTATGDVTGTATGTSSIAPSLVIGTNKVLNTMLAQMPAITIKGNSGGSTANASDLTGAQVNTILPVFTSTLNGIVPFSGGGTANFLRADGTWTSPSASSWSINGNAGTTASNFMGTTDNTSVFFKTNSIQAVKIDNNQNVAIGTAPVFSATNPEKLLVDAGSGSFNVISGKGNLNNYLQLNVQNSNAGTIASSDIVATNDAGTEANGINYVDLGVNSSANTSTGVLGGANTGYLYSTGNDFSIGNATASKNLLLFTGGIASTNERMRVDGNGNVGIGTTTPSQKLDVAGTINASGDVFSGGNVWVDRSNANTGTSAPGLRFGSSSTGETIASNRSAGTNQNGLDFYTSYNNRMSITNGGNVGVGTATPGYKFTVAGIVAPSADNSYSLGGGTGNRWTAVYATNGTIQTSDRRLKTNIQPLTYGLKEVLAMQPVSYNWKTTPDSNHKIGLIAQDVKLIVPEVVTGDEAKEKLGMNYGELVPVLINAIKEQQKEIDELKKDIQLLKNNK